MGNQLREDPPAGFQTLDPRFIRKEDGFLEITVRKENSLTTPVFPTEIGHDPYCLFQYRNLTSVTVMIIWKNSGLI